MIKNSKDFKTWRLDRGWSQKETAEKLGYTQRLSVTLLETGKQKITPIIAMACEYLKLKEK